MDYKHRLTRIELGLPALETASITFDTGLNAAGHSLAQWMASNFNHNFDAYDKAIDSVYNATHIGGSQYHHLIDGQHSFLEALKSVHDVSTDDSFARELSEASEHLLRDTTSVSGINPLFSLSESQFERLAEICKHLGISKPYLADMLTINAPELIGGTIGLLASLVLAKSKRIDSLSTLSGAYLISALSSANPLLLPIAAGGMVYSASKAEDKKKVVINSGKGALVSGGTIAVSGLIGGPVWLSCLTAMGTAVVLRSAFDNPEKAFERIKSIVPTANNSLRKYILSGI